MFTICSFNSPDLDGHRAPKIKVCPARPPLNFKLSCFHRAEMMRPGPSRENRDPEHQPPPKERKSGVPRRRGSIDTLTPALDDHCSIAAYLRLCPPSCPNRDIQGENTTFSSRGSEEGRNKRLPPDREQYIQQPQRAPASPAISDKGRA